MWRPYVLLVIAAAILVGCATTNEPGSRSWHKMRIDEIEASYDAGEITTEQYLEHKSEVDDIRAEYLERRGYRRHPHVNFGFGVHIVN